MESVDTNDSWINDFTILDIEAYADRTSKPGYVFRPSKDWLARMRKSWIDA